MQKKQNTGGKNAVIALGCILAAAALIAALVFASAAERKAVVKKTLNTFYNALYVESDLTKMSQCLAEESRADFETVMTMAGINTGFYRNYVQDAILELGENFSVNVRITEFSEYGAAELTTLRGTFPNAEGAALAKYEIVFTSQAKQESVYTNEMILVMVNNRWYMSTYLTLPIGANMAVDGST